VIRRDDGVKFTPHCAHEDCVGGERSIDSRCTSSGLKYPHFFVAEPAALAGVRIERA